MSFADPDVHARRRGSIASAITFEFGHESTREGIVLQVDGVSGGRMARAIGERAFELAGEQAVPPVHVPGWWAVMFGIAGGEFGLPFVQRHVERAETHVVVVVQRHRMIEVRPSWPQVRLSPTGPWLDLRGEAALRHGPSDDELRAYAQAQRLDEPLDALAHAFDVGVLEWVREDPRTGRMGLRGARAK